MKNFKFYLVAGLMTLSTSAFAQFANTGNNNAGSTKTVDTENYDRVEISYAPTKLDDVSVNGFAIGYTHGLSISKTLPLFVEFGANLNYASQKVDEIGAVYSGMVSWDDLENFDYDDFDMSDLENLGLEQTGDISCKVTKLAINIPVNLAYKFTLSNPQISIVPYLGVNFKFNVIAKLKYEYENISDAELAKDWGLEDGQEVDCFDKDDMGGDDYTWNRFQIGWHVGAGVNYKALYAGLKYGTDFTEISKGFNSSSWAITVGYNF